MNVWFCSDAHFAHKNICKYTDRSKFTSQEDHDHWLVSKWNKYVKPDDLVYHLGDFCFSEKLFVEYVNKLNGVKCFIKGNHDSSKAVNKVLSLPSVSSFTSYKEVKIEGQQIILCHFPFSVWHKQHYGSWNLYGHCHGSHTPVGKQLDVGFDNAYKVLGEHRPFSFSEVLQFMQKQCKIVPDHHVIREAEVL